MDIQVQLSSSGSLSGKALSLLMQRLRQQVSLAAVDEFRALRPDLTPAAIRDAVKKPLDFEVRRLESGSWEILLILAANVLTSMITSTLTASRESHGSWRGVADGLERSVQQVVSRFAGNLTRRIESLKSLGGLRVEVAESSFVEYSPSGRPVLEITLRLAPRPSEAGAHARDHDYETLHGVVARILDARRSRT